MTAPCTERLRLPNHRASLTFDVHHAGHSFTATISRARGRIIELFLTSAKTGTAIEATAHDAAIVISIALQHGVEALAHSVTRDAQGAPSSLIGAALDALIDENKHGS